MQEIVETLKDLKANKETSTKSIDSVANKQTLIDLQRNQDSLKKEVMAIQEFNNYSNSVDSQREIRRLRARIYELERQQRNKQHASPSYICPGARNNLL